MTMLHEFVRDGVARTVLDFPQAKVRCHYIMEGGKPNTSEVYLHDDGSLSVGVHERSWSSISLTPTQLRALSAMALWAAEQMEKKQ